MFSTKSLIPRTDYVVLNDLKRRYIYTRNNTFIWPINLTPFMLCTCTLSANARLSRRRTRLRCRQTGS
jgi:hypothetical protein